MQYGGERKQSDATYPLFFYMVDSADHIAGKTGLTPTVTISKNGATFASPSGAVTEVGNGWYKVAGNATDSNTLGMLLLHATATGADPTDIEFKIVTYDPFTFPTNFGALSIDANGRLDIAKIAGTAQTARDIGASVLLSPGTGTGQISLSSGAVTVGTNNDKTGYTASTVSDKTGYSISGTKTTLDALNDITAASVWAYGTRTLTSFGTLVADIWGALTSGLTAAGSIGKKLADWVLHTDNKVLLAGTTHTSAVVPTVTAVTNDVGITQAGADKVWSSAARTLTSFGTLVSDIWAAATSGMSTVGSIGKKLADWVVGTIDTYTGNTKQTGDAFARIGAAGAGLTALGDTRIGNLDATVSSRSTLTAQNVWEYATRTLSSFGTLVTSIWANATRSLTDKAGFTISGTKTTLDALNDVTAAAVATEVLDHPYTPHTTAATLGKLANNMAPAAGEMVTGTVDTATFTPTTTAFETSLTEQTPDHYNGRSIIFTSGALKGQASAITDYDYTNSKGKITVTALTEAPANTDSFVIV